MAWCASQAKTRGVMHRSPLSAGRRCRAKVMAQVDAWTAVCRGRAGHAVTPHACALKPVECIESCMRARTCITSLYVQSGNELVKTWL